MKGERTREKRRGRKGEMQSRKWRENDRERDRGNKDRLVVKENVI